jgi:hypothetical protein
MSTQNHGGMKSTEEKSLFAHQSSLTILRAKSSSSKQEEQAKKTMNLTCEAFLLIFTDNFLHAVSPPSTAEVENG